MNRAAEGPHHTMRSPTQLVHLAMFFNRTSRMTGTFRPTYICSIWSCVPPLSDFLLCFHDYLSLVLLRNCKSILPMLRKSLQASAVGILHDKCSNIDASNSPPAELAKAPVVEAHRCWSSSFSDIKARKSRLGLSSSSVVPAAK